MRHECLSATCSLYGYNKSKRYNKTDFFLKKKKRKKRNKKLRNDGGGGGGVEGGKKDYEAPTNDNS